jgi:hypothetical protein
MLYNSSTEFHEIPSNSPRDISCLYAIGLLERHKQALRRFAKALEKVKGCASRGVVVFIRASCTDLNRQFIRGEVRGQKH